MPRPVTLELLSTGLDASCHSSLATKEAVYAQIARDIHLMEETIYALKNRHNSLCIVESLPKGLLATIFKWTASMERDSRSCKWLRVGQVCTEWRRVALDCPALWCFYRSTNLNWLDVVLRRSGTLPLYVDQNPFRKSSKGFRQALGEIQRIRELAFTGYSTKHWEKIWKALIKLEAPPLLESFEARNSVYMDVPTLPDNLFKSPLPRLKSLRLHGCLVGKNISLLVNLTSFAIGEYNISTDDGLPVHVAQLMGLLRQAQNLEYLELHRACREVPADEVDDIISSAKDDAVRLPRLQHINLTGSGPTCTAILFQISYPTPLAHITLRVHYSRDTERPTSLCTILMSGIRPIHHLRVVPFHQGRYHCIFWGQDSPSLDPPPSAAPDLDLSVEIWDDSAPENSFTCISEALSLEALQVLDIATRLTFTLTKDLWLAVFGDLKNLTTIRVGHATVLGLLQALKKRYLKSDENGNQSSIRRVMPSFKSLRVLVIQAWSFDSSILDKLTKCFTARRRCGAKLQHLSVIESTFAGPNPADTVAKLRKNVREVIWNVQIAIKQPQDKEKRDEDTQSVSSNEVERWDYSSPSENFPYISSPDEDED